VRIGDVPETCGPFGRLSQAQEEVQRDDHSREDRVRFGRGWLSGQRCAKYPRTSARLT